MSALPSLLLHLAGGRQQRVEVPRGGGAISLGRDDDNFIQIPDPGVSRHHARISWREDGACIIEDLDSANGLTLNDAPVTKPEPLKHGDRLRFGPVLVIYEIEQAARLL